MQFNEVTLNDKALFNSYLQGRKRDLNHLLLFQLLSLAGMGSI